MRHHGWAPRTFVALVIVAGCGGPPAGDDAGVDAAAVDSGGGADAPALGCVTDHDCDDGVFCNGMETCSAGRCIGRMLACDDGIACTMDVCNETARSCVSHPADADMDGFPDAHCFDAHGVALGSDCDDADPNRFPTNAETCDHHDEDCDLTTLGGTDGDHDGAIPDACCNPDGMGGMICGRDCNDTNASISQLATEICDTVDNDCDGNVDEHVTSMSWPDADADGYGDASATPDVVCTVPSSRANEGGDCNDGDRTVHPHQTEECNGVDDDCDTLVDETASAACNVSGTGTHGECVAGACVVTSCDAGRFDCNGVEADGCEASLCGDYRTCGGCTRMCGGGLTFCSGGLCAGINPMLAMLGTLHDVTGAPVAGATITSLDTCPVVTATTAADGTYTLGPMTAAPHYVRIEAPGYPTHVQPAGTSGDAFGPILTQTLLDAWSADPDRAASPSADRAIVVIDYGGFSMPVLSAGGVLGSSNEAMGTDLLPDAGPGAGMRQVFMQSLPGRMTVGGGWSDGAGCSINCGSLVQLLLVGGAVTYVPGPFSCNEVCA